MLGAPGICPAWSSAQHCQRPLRLAADAPPLVTVFDGEGDALVQPAVVLPCYLLLVPKEARAPEASAAAAAGARPSHLPREQRLVPPAETPTPTLPTLLLAIIRCTKK